MAFGFEPIITLSDLIVVVTLLFWAWQTRVLIRSIRTDTVQRVYDRHLAMHAAGLDHPRLQRLTAGRADGEAIADLDDARLQDRSFISWNLDLAEMLFFLHQEGSYPLGDQYVRRLAQSPRVAEYWRQHRGTFNADFEVFFEGLLQETE